MQINNTQTKYTLFITFTDEEFEIIKKGWIEESYSFFIPFLWNNELENYLEEAEIYYMTKGVEIILSENKPELVEKVIQEFLNTAVID